jgi:hypothetical protein
MSKEKIRLNLQVSEYVNNILSEIAESSQTSKVDVIRQAIALIEVAHTAKKQGKHIGIVSDTGKLEAVIIGVL